MSESPQGKITTQNAALLDMLREKSADMNHNQLANDYDGYPDQSAGRTLADDTVKVYVDSPVFPHEHEDHYKFVSTNVDDIEDSPKLDEQRTESEPLGKPPLPLNSRAGQFMHDGQSGASPDGSESYERSRLKNGAPQRKTSFGSNRSTQFVIRTGKENLPQDQRQRPSWTPPSSQRSPMGRRQSPSGYAERHRNRSRSGSRNNSADRKHNRADVTSGGVQPQPVQPIQTPFGRRDNTELEDEELRQEARYQSSLQEHIEVQKHETEHLNIPKLDLDQSPDGPALKDSLELHTFDGQKFAGKAQLAGSGGIYDSLDVTDTHVNREAILRDSLDEYGMPEPDMDYNPYSMPANDNNHDLYNDRQINQGQHVENNRSATGEDTYRLLEQNQQVADQPRTVKKAGGNLWDEQNLAQGHASQTIPVASQGVVYGGQVLGNPVLMQGNLPPMMLQAGKVGEGVAYQQQLQYNPVQYQFVPNVGYVPVMNQNVQPVMQGQVMRQNVPPVNEQYAMPQNQNNPLLRGNNPAMVQSQIYQGDAYYQTTEEIPQENVPERVSPQGHQEMQQVWYDAPQQHSDRHHEPDVYYSSNEHHYHHKQHEQQENTQPQSPPKNNYIEENKKTFGKAKKESSYGSAFAKKKGASSAPNLNRAGLNDPSDPEPRTAQSETNDRNNVVQNDAENIWMKQSKMLTQHKNGKQSGKKARKNPLYKVPSEGTGLNKAASEAAKPRHVQPLQHRPVPKQAFTSTGQNVPGPVHSNAEPHRLQSQPFTHTVYTEDGQKVSVDINLKVLSPTPSNPTGGAALETHPHHQPPPQFRPADYRPDNRVDPAYNYTEGYDYPEQYPTPHDQVSGKDTHRTYNSTPSTVGSPYKVLPPISASDQESGTPRGRSNQRTKNRDKSPNKEESPTRGTLQGSYRDEYERQKAKKIDYKEYTLDDYRKLKKEMRLGGLGPDLDNQTLREKREKVMRKQEYAKQVNHKNKYQDMRAPPRQRQPELDEDDDAINKRRIALEYARNVPKPKVVVHMRNTETNTDTVPQPNSIPAIVQLQDHQVSPGRSEVDPELIGLQELKARHDREVAKVAQIRHKIESAT